jgi:AcrR family transcriptional regulator
MARTRATPRRQRAPQVRRADLLDAAERCFAERGYHETTVDAIAERAGVSKGAFYWHFDSKRDVFTALIDRVVGEVQPRWAEFGAAPTAALALGDLLAAAPGLTESSLPLTDASLEYLIQARRDPELSQRLVRQLRAGRQVIVEQIRRGIEAGEFRDVDPEAYATAIVAAGKGLGLLRTIDLGLEFESAWAALVDVVLRGLAR